MEPQPAAEAAGAAQPPAVVAQSRQRQHPSTLHMVIEAVRAQDQGKGASVIAIKRFILAKYPTVDPVRFKFLLKQALSKGLSRGELVRPHNSSAVGATGRFKLAPEKLEHKQPLGQTDPDEGQATKPGRKGTTKKARAPAATAQQPGKGLAVPEATLGCPGPMEMPWLGSPTAPSPTGPVEEKLTAAKQKPSAKPTGPVEEKLTAAKQKPRAKPTDVQLPAAAKPRSNGTKSPQAASRPRAPGKRRAGALVASAAEDAGGDDGDSPIGAEAEGPQKAPVGMSKGEAPRGAQQDAPKAKEGQGKARKPRAAPGAKGEPMLQKAAPGAKGEPMLQKAAPGAEGEPRLQKAAPGAEGEPMLQKAAPAGRKRR